MKILIKVMFFCFLLFMMPVSCMAGDKAIEEVEMNNLTFFQSLDYEDGLSVVTEVFEKFSLQYAATLGLDGTPQIRPIEYKFSDDGVLYFDTVTRYESYRELQSFPYIQLCICDQETMTYVRLGGKVNFTSDPDVIEKCFDESEVLSSQFGSSKDLVVGYYLTEAWAEFVSFSKELPSARYELKNKYDTDGLSE